LYRAAIGARNRMAISAQEKPVSHMRPVVNAGGRQKLDPERWAGGVVLLIGGGESTGSGVGVVGAKVCGAGGGGVVWGGSEGGAA